MKNLFTILLFLFSIEFLCAQVDGPFEDYYDTGELKLEGQYKNKKRFGDWKSYYKNGQASSVYSYKYGKRNKEYTSHYEDGTLKIKTEKVEGVFIRKEYYESGRLQSENQLKSGYFKGFLENGALEVEANYKDDELSGAWKHYGENGAVEWLVSYKDGYRNGLYKQFYKNGDIKLEGENEKDKKNGEEKRYLPNKVLEWKGNYSKDKLNKTWVKFDTNGEKVKKIKFKNGVASNSETETSIVATEVPDGVIERVPVYLGCENVFGNKIRNKCMGQKVNKLILSNFNKKLAVDIGLSGKQRIFVIFKIDMTGNVKDIKVKAPHPILKIETLRVIKMIPKLQPGFQRGIPVTVPFSLPIVFQVQ